MIQIDSETFNQLVEFAALGVNEQEAEYLRREMNNQLKAIDELTAIPFEGSIEAAPHGLPYSPENRPPNREDVVQAYSNPQTILDCAPETQDGYIVVADTLSKTLE